MERLPDARVTISQHLAQLDFATVLTALRGRLSGDGPLVRSLDEAPRTLSRAVIKLSS